VKLLTDPVPQLVSLVEHGANQSPFLVVKSLKGASEMSKRGQVAKTEGSVQETRADLQKMVFSGSAFATETAVRSYLDAKAYKGAVITQDGTDFVVKGLDESKFDPASLRTIQAQKGLVMHVGTLLEEPEATVTDKTAGTTQEEPVSILRSMRGAPELTQKWSSWMAEYSEADTLAAALEAGKDGLPPGIYEINCAFYAALKNILGSDDAAGKPEKVKAVCAEYADYINALQAILEDNTVISRVSKAALLTAFKREPVAKTDNINIRLTFNGDTATVNNDEKPSEPGTAAILPAATGTVNGPGEVNGTGHNTENVGSGFTVNGTASNGPGEIVGKSEGDKPAEPAAAAAAPAAEGAAKTAEGEAPVQPVSPAEGAAIEAAATPADPIAAVLKAMTDGFTSLSAAITTQATEQKAALAKVEETVTKTAERVDAVENRSTSRKSAAEAGVAQGTQEKAAKSAEEVKHTSVLRGNLLGRTRRR
jgi:hypothetical protein